MSHERGWKAINLEMTDKIPHHQYISHDEFILKKGGIDTRDPSQKHLAWPRLAKALDYDFVFNFYEMPLIKGRETKMGHAAWSNIDSSGGSSNEQGGEKDANISAPFKTVEEVLSFDPVEEYGIPDFKDMVSTFSQNMEEGKKFYPDAVYTGGRYHSLFSACIRTFGWDMFLNSVAVNEERFDRVLNGFLELTIAEAKAWLETDMRVYITHDDIVWSTGTIFSPAFYKKYIFPKYKKLWDILHEKGIKVLYCADGNFNDYIDDVIEAGADGLIFEPLTSLDYVVEKYGKTHVIMGNADCRILMLGNKEDIYKEVKRCIDLGRNCPGYFFVFGNHIPNKIPIDNIYYMFEVFEKLRKR